MFLSTTSVARALSIVSPLPLVWACGARSEMLQGDGGATPAACSQDGDCFDGNLCVIKACVQGYCSTIESKSCDDNNVCTADSCNTATGDCVFTPRVHDYDGDGFYGPLPGTVAGTPGSCGNDCNDFNASVHPGASELCDGLDNNCDGIIDNGIADYVQQTQAVRVVDDSYSEGAVTGLVFNGNYFGLTLIGVPRTTLWQGYFTGYDAFGANTIPIVNETQTTQGGFSGPLLWTGSLFATAWEIGNGNNNYDIFFNVLDERGKKMGPDLRLTNSPGFSVSPSLLWDGSGYWVAWSDDNGGDQYQILGRTISSDGQTISDTITLTEPAFNAVSPHLLRSPTSNLLLFHSVPTRLSNNKQICGRLLGSGLIPMGSSFCLPDVDVSDYSADWVGDRFVVAWSDAESLNIGSSIWATSIDAAGNVSQPAVALASGIAFAREPSVLSLGNRVALAWSDDRNVYNHYGVRLAVFSPELSMLSSNVQTMAETQDDCRYPGLAAGGSGLALVYMESTNGQGGYPYFLGLACGSAE